MLSHSGLIRRFSEFVPPYKKPLPEEYHNFKVFIESFNKILILTGAGVSTESGIPDYRSENVGAFARTSFKPIQYSEFVKNADARKRYWARNFFGWPRFRSFFPNSVHFFVHTLQMIKEETKLITQNVDGLHSKAGSTEVVELHGNAFWVRCINCGHTMHRDNFQKILQNKNPLINIDVKKIRPDGDVEIQDEEIKNFEVPFCEKCGGILKPTVVFFGDNVPPQTVEEAEKLVENCDSMLILGTSLSTLSSLRLVTQAYDSGKVLFIVNIGPTRGDKMADFKISAKISDLLQRKKFNIFTESN